MCVYVFDSEEEDQGALIDNYGDASDEEDGIGLLGSGVTKDVEYMQNAFKSSSLSSYVLEPSHLVTQVFENNRASQENLFK